MADNHAQLVPIPPLDYAYRLFLQLTQYTIAGAALILALLALYCG